MSVSVFVPVSVSVSMSVSVSVSVRANFVRVSLPGSINRVGLIGSYIQVHCNTLQHNATQCNTHCITLYYTALDRTWLDLSIQNILSIVS